MDDGWGEEGFPSREQEQPGPGTREEEHRRDGWWMEEGFLAFPRLGPLPSPPLPLLG